MIGPNLKEFSLKSLKTCSYVLFLISLLSGIRLYTTCIYSYYHNYIDNCIIDKTYCIMYSVENNVDGALCLV